MNTKQTDELITTGTAARILGVSSERVRQFTRDGRLPISQTTPLGMLLLRSDVERLAHDRANKQQK